MPTYITTINSKGKSVLSTSLPTSNHEIPTGMDGTSLFLLWSNTFQPDISTESDVDQYAKDRLTGVAPDSGKITTMLVTMEAGKELPFHRTLSLDTIVQLEGETEMELDSGEVVRTKVGDVVVQRATNHTVRNVTPNGGVAKVLCFSQPIVKPLVVAGTTIEG